MHGTQSSSRRTWAIALGATLTLILIAGLAAAGWSSTRPAAIEANRTSAAPTPTELAKPTPPSTPETSPTQSLIRGRALISRRSGAAEPLRGIEVRAVQRWLPTSEAIPIYEAALAAAKTRPDVAAREHALQSARAENPAKLMDLARLCEVIHENPTEDESTALLGAILAHVHARTYAANDGTFTLQAPAGSICITASKETVISRIIWCIPLDTTTAPEHTLDLQNDNATLIWNKRAP